MDVKEIDVLKHVFCNVADRINGLNILNIRIKKNKDGDIEVNYATSNNELAKPKQKKVKIDDKPAPKNKSILKKENKPKAKPGPKKKQGTYGGDELRKVRPKQVRHVSETESESEYSDSDLDSEMELETESDY